MVNMTRKGYKPEQIIDKLCEAETLLNQGATVGEASRKIGRYRRNSLMGVGCG
jgi:hypothetical protein